jgi:hypothetical protein
VASVANGAASALQIPKISAERLRETRPLGPAAAQLMTAASPAARSLLTTGNGTIAAGQHYPAIIPTESNHHAPI